MASTPESKLVKVLRIIFAFLLACTVSALSVSICFNMFFVKATYIEKYFTDYEYVSGTRDSIIQYTNSVYERNGLNNENVESIISYQAVKNAAADYSGYSITDRIGFEESLYKSDIENICDALRADISKQVKLSGQKSNDDSVDLLVGSINSYFTNQININGIENLQRIINLGMPVSYAVIGVFVFLFIFVVLILFFLGEKNRRYRSLRAISIGFLSGGIFDICLGIIVMIISRAKRFDIYPVYLFNQLIKYVDNSVLILSVSGFIIVLISILFSIIAWDNKQNT